MKVPPLNLMAAPGNMDRMPLPLPFSPDLLWRYPLGFPHLPPPSPLFDFKTQMPGSLSQDPRMWTREDVASFLRWCEREFDLPPFDMDKFQMNGKALCLLTKPDLDIRSPGSGDVVHNALQLLIRDTPVRLPSSPLTPTPQRTPGLPPHLGGPLTPTGQTWPSLAAVGDFHNLGHLIHQTNSVTLSPAPSVDSQAGSPQHQDVPPAQIGQSSGSSTQSGSQSDSEDSLPDACNSPRRSPVSTTAPVAVPEVPRTQVTASPGAAPETTESSTNGRLLWDFLQQLLNDPAQRYCNYIAWKNREIGVFKIVDPPGLARLWGIQKNHLSMNYDKMSRALRYYYRVNILRKVQGERHCYQFLRNPGELKNIKNISLLRQQMMAASSASTPNAFPVPKTEECVDYDDGPTDLSVDSGEQPHSGNPFVPHVTIKTEDRPLSFSSPDDGPTDLSMDSSERGNYLEDS